MAETSYGPYTISTLPQGKGFHAGVCQQTISASGSGISIQVERVYSVDGQFWVVMKDALPADQKNVLDGSTDQAVNDPPSAGSVLGNHDGTPPIEVQQVQRRVTVGHQDTVLDGGSVVFEAGEWAWVEWVLPEGLHLTTAHVCWENWEEGDRGFAALASLAAMIVLPTTAQAGQPTVDLTAMLGAPYNLTVPQLYALLGAYDPAQPATPSSIWVEVWDAPGGVRSKSPGLLELREVDSVNYTNHTITFKENLANVLSAGFAALIPEYGLFSVPRGENNLEAGIFLCGSGFKSFGSPDRSEATELLPAGQCICMRVKASAAAATRCISVTFEMRRPD